jgi:hypothetical protein
MLLKKSPHAVAAPQVKISTSQIGLQAARESWLGVKRPMKTSRNSSAPTFSTASADGCLWAVAPQSGPSPKCAAHTSSDFGRPKEPRLRAICGHSSETRRGLPSGCSMHKAATRTPQQRPAPGRLQFWVSRMRRLAERRGEGLRFPELPLTSCDFENSKNVMMRVTI